MKDYSRGVVRISFRFGEVLDFLGTGFLISPIHIVTCNHVVNKRINSDLWISGTLWRSGGRRVINVRRNDDRDIAVLTIDGAMDEVDVDCILALTAREPAPGKTDSTTNVIGFMDALSDVVIRPVSVISYQGWAMTRVLQNSMAPGMSGSPALDGSAVWGVLQATSRDQGVSHIIPIRAVSEFLREALPKTSGSAAALPALTNPGVDFNTAIDQLWPPLFANIRLQHDADFATIRAFFNHVLRAADDTGHDVAPVNIVTLIEELRQASTPILLRLSAPQGTGKSTAVLTLNAGLRYFANIEKGPTPILVDAEKYLREPIGARPNSESKLIRKDFERLRALIMRDTGKYVVIIDGISADNQFSDEVVRQSFELQDAECIQAIIVAVAENFVSHFASLPEVRGITSAIRELRLIRVSLEEGDVDSFIKDYINLYDQLRGRPLDMEHLTSRSRAFRDRLRLFGLSQVDVNSASMILTKIDSEKYRGIRSLASFLERYARERLGDLNGDADAETLEFAAELACRITKGIDVPRILSRGSEKAITAWQFIREHPSYRDFLTAWYIVTKLENAHRNEVIRKEITEDRILACDFPEAVNQFVKSIVNEDSEKLDGVFETIVMTHQHVDIITRTFMYYIVGRFEKAGPAQQAHKLLSNVKDTLTATIDDMPSKGKEKERIENKVLLRTILVSLIYLRDDEAWEELLDRMLSDQETASINRGFHRVYYGDSILEKSRYNDAARYLDDEEASWQKSLAALKTRIDKHIVAAIAHKAVGSTPLFELNVFTLVSFAQSRFAHNPTNSIDRTLVRELVGKCSQVTKNEELVAYIRSCGIDMDRGDVSPWRFILDLYQLKTNLRQGWLDRGVGKIQDRRVESVAEHTYLACLLAWFLLPPERSDIEDYSKSQILGMLLVHDIAEALTGDHVVAVMTGHQVGAYLANEIAAMQYIRMKDTYPGIYDAAAAFGNWRRFEDNRKDGADFANARIAKDIDRLDNYLQLYLYKENMAEALYHDFESKLRDSFQTALVKQMVTEFREWERSQPPALLSKFDHFLFRPS